MKRLISTAVLAFLLGSGFAATASGLLSERVIPAAICTGAGYVGMSADFTVVMICTSDGQLHWLEAH